MAGGRARRRTRATRPPARCRRPAPPGGERGTAATTGWRGAATGPRRRPAPLLEVHALHVVDRVARAGAGADRRGVGDPLQIGFREPYAQSPEILFEALLALGARDGDHVLALRQHPGEGELRRGALLFLRDRLEPGGERHVLVQVLALEAWMREAPVAFGQVLLPVHRAGEHAAAERRVGDERDAELARGAQRFLSLAPIHPGKFILHRGDRMHLVRAADGLGTRLGQAERAHLALLDQLLHRADGLLDRHVRIDAGLVIEVDHVDAEALEAGIAGLLYVFRPAVDALLAVGAFHLPELRHHQRLLAPAVLERPPEQRLVVAPAVHVGRIEVVHAALEGVMDDADGLLVVGVSVDAGHRHQAEADRGDFDRRTAELALFHCVGP